MNRLSSCQALVEDYKHPRFRASMQRITVPREKPCSRRATETVVHLALCKTHARLAREGFISEKGVVLGKNDIREIRNKNARRPGAYGRHYGWAPR